MMQLTLKTRVMLGVYALYAIRRLRSPFVGELFVLALLCACLSFFVSLPHIISNIMITKGSYAFFIDAFAKTNITVRLIVVSAAASCGLFVRNISVFTANQVKQRFV